jgi:putative acetyltransferase
MGNASQGLNTGKSSRKDGADGPAVRLVSPAATIQVRARELSDLDAIAAIRALPAVRWGTLAMPFVGKDRERRMAENSPEGTTALVAEIDQEIVAAAELAQLRGRRSHIGKIGISVHDSFHRQGVGTALMAALVDLADNWLNLTRLELEVFVDNPGAIRLYQKFGFVIEGTACQYAFRDGRYVDAHHMARIRPSV